MRHILKCQDCKTYTLKEKCPNCGKEVLRPQPPKFSPLDKYGDYRRRAKHNSYEKADLI
ncbi:MAG TPA: RNA-protein complex protein Nop10 [Candidatus Nanoarchaeia archaeon]|nr:RNA-protein complex protein Nop10 [Candidatus Nanoarchaeia archaeon]